MMYTYYTKEGKFETKYIQNIQWRNLHKVDGPAVISSDGRKEWFINGKCHRLGGLAIEYEDGTKEWYKNGKIHRLDGPAIEFNDGYKYWYINGRQLDSEEIESWIKENNINLKTKEHQVLFMLMFG